MKKAKSVRNAPFVPQIEGGHQDSTLETYKEHLNWLERKRLILTDDEFSIPDEHEFCPSVGVIFQVLKPLESCGNTPNGKEHCQLLGKGTWMTIGNETSTSSYWATFRKLGPKLSAQEPEDLRLCVGYNMLSVGGPAIMAWKDNIRPIKRKVVRR